MKGSAMLLKNVKRIKDSSLFRASSIYTLSSFVNASIPFLLLPILTKRLTHADFGIVTMFNTLVSFLLPFIGLNMEAAIARRYYSDKNKISRYIGGCIFISLFSTVICFLVVMLFRDKLSQYTAIPYEWIKLSVVLTLGQFWVLIVLTLYQVRVKPIFYGSFQIGQSIINFGLSALLIISLGMKWEGRIIAQLISASVFSVIAIGVLLFKKDISMQINRKDILHAIKFGGGLVPHALGGLLIIMTNRFFLVNMISVDETGLYSAASQIASVISFFTISFNNAFVPWLYKNLSLDDIMIKRKIVKFTYLYFFIILVGGGLFYLFIPIVFKLFINHSFLPALKYCFWIILGFCFQGMYFMVTNYITYSERTHVQAIITLVVGLLNIPVNYFLIHWMGSIGAAVAFCICFFLLFASTWFFSGKIYKMPWNIFLSNNN